MLKRAVLFALVITCVLAAGVSAGAPEALDWIKDQQNPDGGFGDPSAVGGTIEVLLAITAAGEDVTQWTADGNTPVDFLEANVADVAGPGPTAKLIVALMGAGISPTDFGDVDLAQQLEDSYDDATGRFGGENGTVPGQAFAIMALKSVGRPVSAKSVNWLIEAQNEDGSWAWNGDPETQGDTNTTALAIQALAAVDAGSETVNQALAYLKRVQNEDAGWPYQKPSDFGTDTDANSTAYVIQALHAAGEDLSDWAVEGTSPLDRLQALQKDNGAFQWQAAAPDDNFLATVQAVPALAGKAYPLVMSQAMAETEPAQLPTTGGVPLPTFALTLAGLALVLAGLARHKLLA